MSDGFGFSQVDIDGMRLTHNDYLPDRCTILRAAFTKGPAGEKVGELAPAYTDVHCWAVARVLRQLTERIEGGEMASGVRWVVEFPHGTDVQLNDRLVITHRNATQTTLEVNGIVGETDEVGLAVEAMVVK